MHEHGAHPVAEVRNARPHKQQPSKPREPSAAINFEMSFKKNEKAGNYLNV